MDMREQLLIDKQINGYQLTEVQWPNRLGTLYKATELDTNRIVSVQTFTSAASEFPMHPEDLTSHIEGLAGLMHPNIVETHSLQMSSEGPFLVQDYVAGYRLDHYLEKKGALHWQFALRIIRQILSALEYAHNANFLHHRLDPEHIIIGRGSTAKIMQFGLEHLVYGNSFRMAERLLSNPSRVYSAPEHYNEAERGDASSDLYSLGLIAHEILTGKHLLGDSTLSFEGYSPFIANRTRFLEALHPPLPEQLLASIETALSRNPSRRFQNAESMVESLRDIEVQSAQPKIKYHKSNLPLSLITRLRSRHVLIAGGALVLLLLVAAVTVFDKKENPFTALGGQAEATATVRPQRSLPSQAEAAENTRDEDGAISVRIRAIDTNNRSVRGEIFINGESVNAFTPTTLSIPPGSHMITVKALGFEFPMEPQKVTIREDRVRPITIEVERETAP